MRSQRTQNNSQYARIESKENWITQIVRLMNIWAALQWKKFDSSTFTWFCKQPAVVVPSMISFNEQRKNSASLDNEQNITNIHEKRFFLAKILLWKFLTTAKHLHFVSDCDKHQVTNWTQFCILFHRKISSANFSIFNNFRFSNYFHLHQTEKMSMFFFRLHNLQREQANKQRKVEFRERRGARVFQPMTPMTNFSHSMSPSRLYEKSSINPSDSMDEIAIQIPRFDKLGQSV